MEKLARHWTTFAKHPWAHHSAVVTRGGKPQSVGYNHRDRHAEVVALSKLWPSKREGTTVWSIRVTPGGKLAMAKPCPTCEIFLRKFKVKTVYYSTSDGLIEKIRL